MIGEVLEKNPCTDIYKSSFSHDITMSKVLQIVLVVFGLGIVAFIPFLIGGMFSPSSSAVAELAAAQPAATSTVEVVNGAQVVTIRGETYGYNPASFTVKKGIPVKILFSADPYAGCGRQFIMREFGVNALAVDGKPLEITFTPTQEGTFNYRCSMNMFRGKMTVTA